MRDLKEVLMKKDKGWSFQRLKDLLGKTVLMHPKPQSLNLTINPKLVFL